MEDRKDAAHARNLIDLLNMKLISLPYNHGLAKYFFKIIIIMYIYKNKNYKNCYSHSKFNLFELLGCCIHAFYD